MQKFQALIVHQSDKVSTPLVESLRRLGVPADSATASEEAVAMIKNSRYEGVLLDDELPRAGSLQVMEALEMRGAPTVLMVSVPRDTLPEVRRNAPDEIEFVANPETEPEIEQLALRMRARLINAGLAEDFGPSTQLKNAANPASGAPRRRSPDWRPLLIMLAVLAILLALLLGLRQLQRPAELPGDEQGTGGYVWATVSAGVVIPESVFPISAQRRLPARTGGPEAGPFLAA